MSSAVSPSRDSSLRLTASGRTLDLSQPKVMGILNVTPDSFSDGGQLFRQGQPDLGAVRERALAMIEDGAAILDIGGESTRPGAAVVSVAEELRRVVPVVERLAELDAIISVDTRKPEVAAQVLKAGCHLINDVSGGRDPQMLATVASTQCGYCIMHMQQAPQTMQVQPTYNDVVAEVVDYLAQQVALAVESGIDRQRLLIDPGFGFGKTLDHNLDLLRQLPRFRALAVPVLVGLSRKRMLGTITGRQPEARSAAGVAAATVAMLGGARVVRSHDVAATADAAAIIQALGLAADGAQFEQQ